MRKLVLKRKKGQQQSSYDYGRGNFNKFWWSHILHSLSVDTKTKLRHGGTAFENNSFKSHLYLKSQKLYFHKSYICHKSYIYHKSHIGYNSYICHKRYKCQKSHISHNCHKIESHWWQESQLSQLSQESYWSRGPYWLP